jgi:hypothetical protein
MNQVDQKIKELEQVVSKINSDTATVEELATEISRFQATLQTDLDKTIWKDVLFDNFMVDTDIQVNRRKSGEFDRMFKNGVVE